MALGNVFVDGFYQGQGFLLLELRTFLLGCEVVADLALNILNLEILQISYEKFLLACQ